MSDAIVTIHGGPMAPPRCWGSQCPASPRSENRAGIKVLSQAASEQRRAEPEVCLEYQTKQCNLMSGRFLFFVGDDQGFPWSPTLTEGDRVPYSSFNKRSLCKRMPRAESSGSTGRLPLPTLAEPALRSPYELLQDPSARLPVRAARAA